jgi:CDGSH-type Zn-finger protein
VQAPGAADGKLRVRPQPDGPLRLDGPFSLTGAVRGAVLSGGSVRLCRCGHSGNKPFCDGSHERTGFRSG